MIDGHTLRAMNRKAMRQSQREGREPFVFTGDKAAIRIPFIGKRTPRGWRRTDREHLFVDLSGFGLDSEPALSQRLFLEALTPGFAYGLIEQGQFQGYVGEFYRKPTKGG